MLSLQAFKYDYTHHLETHYTPSEMERAKHKLGRDDKWYRSYNLVPEIADFVAGMAGPDPGAQLFSKLQSRNKESLAYLMGAITQIAARSSARAVGKTFFMGAKVVGRSFVGEVCRGAV